ncbi:MAG: hypothetical protein II842_12220 [Butyrivibrio sp.]|nr:hypothetical protein [Butyrivibrio sp.]
MINNEKELLENVKHQHHISKEVTDTLIELDQLPSTGTQVFLNDLIVTLYKRVMDGSDDVVVEVFGDKVMTSVEFTKWVEDNFTEYSTKLFKDSI